MCYKFVMKQVICDKNGKELPQGRILGIPYYSNPFEGSNNPDAPLSVKLEPFIYVLPIVFMLYWEDIIAFF